MIPVEILSTLTLATVGAIWLLGVGIVLAIVIGGTRGGGPKPPGAA